MRDASINEKLDEILAEYVMAEESDEPVSREALLQKHPEVAEELMRFFADRDQFRRLASPLSPEAARRNDLPVTVRYFGDYELLEEIAQGGMGVVYKARQTSLNRIVAIKMILAGHLATDADIQRFRSEAQTAASLKHKAIVPIHEVGQQNGQHYFSMDLIKGRNLAELIRTDLPKAEVAARIIKTISEAVDYAHSQGVIHRDIKPSNILVDRAGQVHITDFGLALRVEGGTDVTRTGQVLGTPSYMPPEQARGMRDLVGPASDIYALGAVLYELLTGRPPFRGETAADTIRQLTENDPLSPYRLNSSTPRDLETICLKCLEKEPHKRYGTAALLADDLRLYLAGEPVRARRISAFERVRRWARRRPASAALIVVTIFFAILGFSGLIFSHGMISNALRQKTVAMGNLNRALAEREIALADKSRALQRETNALNKLGQTHAELESQAKELESRQLALYRSMLQLAHAQALGNDVALADRNLEQIPTNLRGWEWRYAKRLCHPDLLTLHGRECVEISSDGEWFAMLGEEEVEIREVPSGELVRAIRIPSAAPRRLAITPDDSQIAIAADQEVKILNTKTWEIVGTLKATSAVRDIQYSPDGRHLAAGCEQAEVRIWNIIEGELLHVLTDHDGPVIGISYAPDGETLVCATTDEVAFWDVDAGKKSGVFDALIDWAIGLAGDDNHGVHDVAFSPNGEIIAIADGDTVRLVNATTYRETQNLTGHNGGVQHLSFDSEGRTLATASSDGTVRLWDVQSGQSHRTLPWHKKKVRWVSQGRNGRWLASASEDELKLWDLSRNWAVTPLAMHSDAAYSLAFSEDSTLLVSGGGRYKRTRTTNTAPPKRSDGGEIRVVDLETGQIAFRNSDDFSIRFGVLAVDIAPDGFRVAAAGAIGTRIWNIETGNQLLHIADPRAKGEIWSVDFDPAGRYLVTSSRQHGTVLWDARSGQSVRTFDVNGYVRFSPDGTRLAGSNSGKFKVFRIDDGLLVSEQQLGRSTWRFAYSPDGSCVAFSYDTRQVDSDQKQEFAEVRDSASGRLMMRLESNVKRDFGSRDYISGVYGICYSPDGLRIATASGDKTVRIWDAVTGEELLILDHPNQVFCVEFSPDGKQLATASGHWCGPRDGEIRLYEAP